MSFKCPCNAGQLCYVPYPFNRINKTGFSSGINGGQAHHVKLKPMAKLYYGLDFTHLHVREVSIMRTVIVCVLFSFVQKGLSLLVTVSIDERHTRRHPHKILGRTESGELSWTDLNNLQYHLPEGKKKKKKKRSPLLECISWPFLYIVAHKSLPEKNSCGNKNKREWSGTNKKRKM